MAKRKIDISPAILAEPIRKEPEEEKPLPMTAKCKKCGEVKPLDQFWKSRKQKSGHSVWCRLCLGEGREKPEEQGS